MKILKISFLLVSMIMISCQVSKAQNSTYSHTNKKAIKLFEEAKVFYQNYQLPEAIARLNDALEKESNFVEAYTLMGYVYVDSKNNEGALQSFKKALQINPDFAASTLYFVGQLELERGEYVAAEKYFQQFMKSPVADPKMRNDAFEKIDGLNFAMEAIKNPVPFNPINLGEGVNSAYPEYFPSLTVDGATMLFTRQLPEPNSPVKYNEDFYISEWSSGKWGEAKTLGSPINTENNEGAPSLSADGQLLIFTACELYGEYGGGRKGLGSCDLFFSQRVGNRWNKPMNLGTEINSKTWETQPSFSADGKTLYFIRRVKERNGNTHSDIFVSELDNEGYWKTPVRLPDHINTQKNEESVFIHPDGQTLYFASNGHLGMGGLDIYIARKNEKGEWGAPMNLGYPINTFKNENSILISPDGKKAYFASDREGGFGGLDLYEFELPKSVQPQTVSYLAGKVIDADTRQPLGSRFELYNLENEELVVSSFSDQENGDFLVALPLAKNYALNVSKPGYLFYSENFTLKEKMDDRPYEKNIALKKIKVGEKVILRNIFYATNKYDLLAESKSELKKLVEFLDRNSAIKVEIGGHTDDVGSTALNQELSNNRAKEVYLYLIGKGIDSSRLSYKGFGANEPVASNATEEGRAQNRRTEFTVVAIN